MSIEEKIAAIADFGEDLCAVIHEERLGRSSNTNIAGAIRGLERAKDLPPDYMEREGYILDAAIQLRLELLNAANEIYSNDGAEGSSCKRRSAKNAIDAIAHTFRNP